MPTVMRRILFLLNLIICLTFASASLGQGFEQYEDSTGFNRLKDRFYGGGNLGAGFGALSYVNLSPLVGFKFTDRFSIGSRPSYQLVYEAASKNAYHVFGGSVLGRYRVFERAFVTTEYELLNVPNLSSGERVTIPYWYVGAGYIYPVGQNVGFSSTILFDLLNATNAPVRWPVFRAGIVVGL